MDFDFIDNSPADESKRSDVIKQFVDFVDKTLGGMTAEEAETDFETTSSKSIDAKNGELRISISKRLYKNKPVKPDEPPFEDTRYEIDLNISHFSDAGTTIHSETYIYSENDPSTPFVERMTGNMSMDGVNTNHTTEKHEVGSVELTKIIQLVSNTLASSEN